MLVEIEPGRASLPELVGAIDAALCSDVPGLEVRVPVAAGDARRETLEHLCGADPRIRLATDAAPAAVTVTLPARARPQPRTLPALVDMVRADGLAEVAVPVPGRIRALARLMPPGVVRVRTAGSGTRRVRPGEVALRSTVSRGTLSPPPKASLEAERAEHLRHRARSATMRARMDRNSQRLYRERLQSRHDRSRRHLAEQRLATTSRGEWVRWRLRAIGRRIASLPALVASAFGTVRVFIRRTRRFAAERWRARGAPQS